MIKNTTQQWFADIKTTQNFMKSRSAIDVKS
jgi:hypothetical protein